MIECKEIINDIVGIIASFCSEVLQQFVNPRLSVIQNVPSVTLNVDKLGFKSLTYSRKLLWSMQDHQYLLYPSNQWSKTQSYFTHPTIIR